MFGDSEQYTVELRADLADFERGMRRAQGDLRGFGDHVHRTGSALGGMFKVGAIAAGGALVGVGGALGYAVKQAATFQATLAKLHAVTGAGTKQMKLLHDQALQMGAATKFSAQQAAQAQVELAKGGLSVSQIMKGGLKSALALAAAGEMDLADAANTTVNAMQLFGLHGKASMKVADALAQAASSTTADVKDFAMALNQGGGAAKTAGLSFTDTITVLEALAKSGYKNSDAGTSMKNAFIQIIKPTQQSADEMKKLGLEFIGTNGKLKDASQISDMLREKLSGMTSAQRAATFATIAGTDGFRTLQALYDAGPAKINKWHQELDKQGTATRIAAQMNDTLQGHMERLHGSIDTLAIKLGEKLVPALDSGVQWLTKAVDYFGSAKFASSDAGRAIGSTWDTVKQTSQRLLSWFEANWPTIKNVIREGFRAIRSAWDNVGQPVFDYMRDRAAALVGWFREHWPQIKQIAHDVFAGIKTYWTTILQPLLSDILTIAGNVVTFFVNHWPEISAVIKAVWSAVLPSLKAFRDLIHGIATGQKAVGDGAPSAWGNFGAAIHANLPGIFGALDSIAGKIQKILDLYHMIPGAPSLGSAAASAAKRLIPGAQAVSDLANATSSPGGGPGSSPVGGGVGTAPIRLRATGGDVRGPTLVLAGENPQYPREWFITPDPRHRDKNIAYWLDAGKAMGIVPAASGLAVGGPGSAGMPFGVASRSAARASVGTGVAAFGTLPPARVPALDASITNNAARLAAFAAAAGSEATLHADRVSALTRTYSQQQAAYNAHPLAYTYTDAAGVQHVDARAVAQGQNRYKALIGMQQSIRGELVAEEAAVAKERAAWRARASRIRSAMNAQRAKVQRTASEIAQAARERNQARDDLASERRKKKPNRARIAALEDRRTSLTRRIQGLTNTLQGEKQTLSGFQQQLTDAAQHLQSLGDSAGTLPYDVRDINIEIGNLSAQAAADAATSVPEAVSTAAAYDPTQLPDDVQMAIAEAGVTADTADDRAALERAQGAYTAILAGAQGPLDAQQRISVLGALGGVNSQIQSIDAAATTAASTASGAGSPGSSPDDQAIIAQLTNQLTTQKKTAAISNAALAAFGGVNFTVNQNNLTPGSPQVLDQIRQAVVAALNGGGMIPASSTGILG